MKYWRINISCNPQLSNWIKDKVLDDVIAFLADREYSYYKLSSELLSPDKNIFKLRKVWNSDGNIFSVFIENKTNWTNSSKVVPQIVHLISDYFKINSNFWYYLEMLTEKENEKINKSRRHIEPFQIKEVFKNWTDESIPIKPKIIEIGTYNYGQTDIYYGKKNDYDSHLSFWISCIYWNNYGELEPNELLEFYINNTFYDLECGCCIPIDYNEIEKVIQEIKDKSGNLDTPINTYLMRKKWNDTIYILEYKDRFLMYNWHTAE